MQSEVAINIIATLSILCIIPQLGSVVNLLPSLTGCLIRWKENINIDSNVKISRDRDILALSLFAPLCLTINHFHLFNFRFTEGWTEIAGLGVTAGILIIYMLFRLVCVRVCRPHKTSRKTYSSANTSFYNFFIFTYVILLLSGGLMDFAGVEEVVIKSVMLWLSALIYALYLVRKAQIFASSCSVFNSILYLCALELIPTGLLVFLVVIL